MAARAHLSIGEVLSLVQEEFPDITISKIRFLESQGLLDPERTPSGYRKFYDADIERLQWILTQQRDHFLPLKVIRDRLDEWDATGQRPASAGSADAADDTIGQRWDETPPEVPVLAEPEPAAVAPTDADVRHAAASLASASAIEVATAPSEFSAPDTSRRMPGLAASIAMKGWEAKCAVISLAGESRAVSASGCRIDTVIGSSCKRLTLRPQ